MMEFAANHYDGVTSRAREVSVWIDDQNVLHLSGVGAPLGYSLADVQIAPRVGSTFRALLLPGGARCETYDRRIVEEIERRQGVSLPTALFRRVERNVPLVGVVALALALSLVAVVLAGIPALAERAVRSLPASVAQQLGKSALTVLDRTELRPSELPISRRFEVQRGFDGLARRHPALPLTLEFRSGIGPNALALPDGTVIVTDELVEFARDDGEILAAIAHEIGHVHHAHGLRLAFESSTALVLASTYVGDVTAVTALSGVLPAALAHARYSREHEQDADDFAVALLAASGVEPQHFANLLRRLGRRSLPNPGAQFAYLASHPPLPERIARLEATSTAR
jgi:Zn-dependent protease with chaperone function